MKLIIGIILAWSSMRAAGQADSILSLPGPAQQQGLFGWFENYNSKDSSTFLPLINKVYDDFIQARREDLARTLWMLRINYLVDANSTNEVKAIGLIDQGLSHTIRQGWKIQEAELYIRKGYLLRNYGRLVNGFENMIRGYEQMKQIGFQEFPTAHRLLYMIGLSYFHVKAHDQATVFMKQAVNIPLYNPESEFLTLTYNMLGLCYMRQLQYDSAIVAFQKSHDYAKKANMPAYVGLTSGNIGNAYYKLGNYDAALPLLEQDFKLSQDAGEMNSAMHASLALSAIYLERGMKEKAAFHIEFASQHVNRDDDRAMQSYFTNLSDLRKIARDFESALAYRDSALVYELRIQANEEKDILERARLELEIEKHAKETLNLEALRKKQILLRNGLLLILLLTGIILMILIQRRYLLRKRELEKAKLELTMFTNMVREKNELLEAFHQQIETHKTSGEHSTEERYQHMTELMNSQILTEEDWKQFRLLFDKVHPGFFARLKDKLPDLSAAETRLMALTKLHLAPREMASMLGISHDSILKARQRLRKKLSLPEEGTLDDLMRLL